ncbi:hypothetical protein CJ030_MR1G008438 [Morella rubra]|uniref:Uncharacterized protein n=1 Tax=Morella rubra TaxID=262757 RepID=A0A6A1WPW4_9ROSI|nr:hypothetical protein CJ030_MR1G008438 [Morella rubra]
MDFYSWWSSGTARNFKSGLNYLKNGYERVVPLHTLVTGSKIARLGMLWRKLKRERKKYFLRTSDSKHVVPSYDPYTYSQNFDQGSIWDDPDNLYRSFSARFAVPSRVFQKS